MTVVTVVWETWADQGLGLPTYATSGAAGADLRANFEDRKAVEIASGARVLISTGLRLAIPEGFEMQLRPRSGLALKYGVTLLNSPGTIDSDYRGPLGVIVVNTGDAPFVVAHGDRICQAVVAPVTQAVFETAVELDQTKRGQGGFGSTGVAS